MTTAAAPQSTTPLPPLAILNPPQKFALLRRVPFAAILLSLILIAYAFFLYARFAPAATEPDDNGYTAQASLLVQTGHTYFTRQSDAQYIGMHWLISPNGLFVSRYPPGLAVAMGTLYALFGFKAATLLNPILALLALWAFYLLSRRLVSAGWALAGVIVLAANPTFVHHALAEDSHMGVLFALVWGLYFAVEWWQDKKLWQVFVMGLFFGCIPSIRYGDSVMALGIAVFLLYSLFAKDRPAQPWKHLLVAAAGVAIPLLPLLIRNQLLMGAFWRTGYSLTNEETGFSWAYFKEHAIDYIRQVNANGVGALFGLGTIGVTVMISLAKYRRLGLMLGMQILTMLCLYMAYYWAPQNNAASTMRFLLPIFPLYLIAAVWLLSTTLQQIPASGRFAVGAILLTMQLLWGTSEAWDETAQLHYNKQVLSTVTDAIDAIAKPGDVVVSNGNALQHFDFVRHFKVADLSLMRGNGRGMGGGGGRFGNDNDPNAPSPQQAEKREEQSTLYPTDQVAREDKFVNDIQKWADGNKLYFVGTQTELDTLMADSGPDESMKILKVVTLPEAPEIAMGGRRNMFGGGGGGGGGGRNRNNNNAVAGNRRAGRNGRNALGNNLVAGANNAAPGDLFGAPPGAAPVGGGMAGGPGGPMGGGFGGPPGMGGMGGGWGGGFGGMGGGGSGEREVLIAEWTFKPKSASAK